MLKLDAPTTVIQGDTIELSCFYSLEGELDPDSNRGDLENLYAVKWYKDGREFFRFLAHERPNKMLFPMDGIHLVVSKVVQTFGYSQAIPKLD